MIGPWRGLLLAQAILVSAAFTDDAVTLQILTPSLRVTAGDTINLTAVGVTATGNILPEPGASWSVDQQGAAVIDYSGHLTGITLGIVTVSAFSGSLRHDILIQVVPDHTIIRPALAKLQIGEQRQFTATAYDKQDRPIPGVPFSWAITSSNGDGTPNVPYATISQTGLLTGGYEGTADVRAMYTYYPQGVIAGMEQRIPVYASFVVSAPRPFRVTRLLNASTQTRQNPHLRPRPSPMWTMPDGSVLFNASLDGAGTALLAWNDSGFHSVIAAGTGSKAPGSLVTDLGVHSITDNGILMLDQTTTDGGVVQLGEAGQLQPLLVTNTSGAGVENLSGFSLTRNSRSSNGYFVFNGGFRVPGTSQYTNGLFRGVGNSVTDVLVNQLDQLPEIGSSGAGFYDYGVDNNGVAWYLASGPSSQVIYRHDASGRQKFLAYGDALLGSTIKGFHGQRNSTRGYFFAENGDVLLGVTLQDGRNFLLRYTGSDPSQPATSLRVNSGTVVLGYRSDGTALIFGNPYPNKGDGAWLWNGDSLQPVALIGKAVVNGQPIQSIESGAIDANGQITLMVATADYPMVVVRAAVGSNPQVLFQAGDAVAVPVPNVIEGFIPDGRTGNPLLMVGSISNAAIAEWRDSDIQPLLSPGDRILGAPPFPGINPYGYAQRTANGDLYIVSNVGVARYSAGQWSTALKFPIKLDDGTTSNNSPYRIAVNNAGAIAWISGTSKQDQRVYLSQNGQNQLICQTGAAIAGETVFNCDSFYVDDLGRVFLQLRMQNDPVERTYVWSQGTWQLAVRPYQTQIAGRPVNYINSIHPMGSHCFAVLGTDAGSYIVEWGDSGWTVVYGPNDTMPTGFPLNNVNYLEANPNGDIAFVSQAYPSQAIYFRRNGVLSTVLTTGRPTEAGDLLVNILGLDLSADGTVYLLAINQNDELVFYSATPL